MKHQQTKKHQYALERYQQKLYEEQAAKGNPQPACTTNFSSPNFDPSLVHRDPPNLLHGLWRLDGMWIDNAGNELALPQTITQDATWTSQRAQDFWREVEDARASEHFIDPKTMAPFEDTDVHAHEPEMPGGFSTLEAREYSPYPSKTVSRKCNCVIQPANIPDAHVQMFILDLLDNKPRLQLSDEHMRSILWALRELGVANVPSLKQFRSMQRGLTEKIHVVPRHHISALGNHFYQNSPGALLAFVSGRFPHQNLQLTLSLCRIGPIHSSVTRLGSTPRSPQRLRSFGRRESG